MPQKKLFNAPIKKSWGCKLKAIVCCLAVLSATYHRPQANNFEKLCLRFGAHRYIVGALCPSTQLLGWWMDFCDEKYALIPTETLVQLYVEGWPLDARIAEHIIKRLVKKDTTLSNKQAMLLRSRKNDLGDILFKYAAHQGYKCHESLVEPEQDDQETAPNLLHHGLENTIHLINEWQKIDSNQAYEAMMVLYVHAPLAYLPLIEPYIHALNHDALDHHASHESNTPLSDEWLLHQIFINAEKITSYITEEGAHISQKTKKFHENWWAYLKHLERSEWEKAGKKIEEIDIDFSHIPYIKNAQCRHVWNKIRRTFWELYQNKKHSQATSVLNKALAILPHNHHDEVYGLMMLIHPQDLKGLQGLVKNTQHHDAKMHPDLLAKMYYHLYEHGAFFAQSELPQCIAIYPTTFYGQLLIDKLHLGQYLQSHEKQSHQKSTKIHDKATIKPAFRGSYPIISVNTDLMCDAFTRHLIPIKNFLLHRENNNTAMLYKSMVGVRKKSHVKSKIAALMKPNILLEPLGPKKPHSAWKQSWRALELLKSHNAHKTYSKPLVRKIIQLFGLPHINAPFFASRHKDENVAQIVSLIKKLHHHGALVAAPNAPMNLYNFLPFALQEEYCADLEPTVQNAINETKKAFAHKVVERTPSAALVLSIIRKETYYNSQDIGLAGEKGLMQVMPKTAEETSRLLNIEDEFLSLEQKPELSIKIGTAYLTRCLHAFDGNVVCAVIAYNAGINAVKRWIKFYGSYPIHNPAAAIRWIESIPFQGTRQYVMHVLSSLMIYRSFLKDHAPCTLTEFLSHPYETNNPSSAP